MGPPWRHRWADIPAIGAADLYALLRLRCEVFVVEQRCAYADVDGLDPLASHLLAWMEGEDALAGCLRVFAPGITGPHARIGRVATARAARGRGFGRWMMRAALERIDGRFPGAATEIGAQVAMEGFYRSLGFLRTSADYDEDGITHCTMLRRPAADMPR